MGELIIQASDLHKDYPMGASTVHALAGVDLSIAAGEFVSITGASGSGKSTLMHILGCLDYPTAGMLRFRGQEIGALTAKVLARIRNRHIGFVFQTFNLVNRTTALDNVVMPLIYSRRPFSTSKARRALQQVGLDDRARHRPSELSGGERQRVAIARAIVNDPDLILADEPTGNLDSRTGEQILGIFHKLHDAGKTIIVVTHEVDVAAQADRLIVMKDGRIVEDSRVDDDRRAALVSTARTLRRAASDVLPDSSPSPPAPQPVADRP